MRESNVVTKVFEVEFAPVPHSPLVDDDLGFQDEIDQEKTRVSNQIFIICLVIYSLSLTWKLILYHSINAYLVFLQEFLQYQVPKSI